MKQFLAALEGHLTLIPTIAAAVQTFQQIGHSKESTLQKVLQIVEVSAAVGASVPVPAIAAISATVGSIVDGVFGGTGKTPAAATPDCKP